MHVLNVLFDDRFGGPSKRVVQVAGALSAEGVRTTVCLPVGEGNAEEVARSAGLPVVRLPFGRPPRPRDLGRVARWAASLPGDVLRFARLLRRERPDVVHVNGAFFFAPALAAKLVRIPLVWHLNDTVVPRRAAPMFGAVVRVLANEVIVAASAVARHYAVARHPHTVVHAAVDLREYERLPENRDGAGPLRIGLVANWNPLKGLEYFLRAAALLQERRGGVEFVFAGARLATHSEYAGRVDALVEELGLRPAVRELGFVSSVAPVVAGLDVLVLSSTSEASPMVILEGMAAGVPVVATDVGGVREMLLREPRNPAGVVVPARDPEALADAMEGLLEDPERAARMGENGRRIAAENFSLGICARRHHEVYRDAVERRQPV